MERPAESLKDFANRAARHISTGAGASVAGVLRMLHETQAPPAAAESGDDPAGAARVGIWEQRSVKGETVFVRDSQAADEWHLWANVGRIPPKGRARRVVLLGESVARGYLYDPAYNPASVLAGILESQLGPGAVEVIDLARTSIEMEIKDVAIAATVLRPDVVVLYCGNNWSYTHPTDPIGAAVLGAAIGNGGAAGLKAHADAALRRRAEQVVDEISGHYAAAGVPVVWITPEFNLGGWRDPAPSAAHLPGDRNRRWLAHHDAARAALAAGDRERAAAAARQMVEGDRGTSAAGYYLLAECGGPEDTDDVRAALEAARDASGWDTAVSFTPRISATVLDVLRDRAQAHGDRLVDSAALFRDHLDGAIPGRRMFLDYCHLTSEGIRVTMSAAAAVLLDVFGAPAATWRQLMPAAPRPPANVESEAYFLAAVHNAHWWQDGATVGHHIAESLRFSTHLVPLMAAFVEQQARRTPPMLSRSAETILESGSVQIQQYLFGREHQCLDPLICGAIVDGLRGAGAELVPRLDRLWRAEHSPECGPTDLLAYYYLSAARQPHEVEWVRPGSPSRDRDYFKAFSPVSRFCFVGDARRPVVLDATWRVPHAAATEESVLVRVNQHPVGALTGGAGWSRHEITVPAGLVRDGLNEVAFEWPAPAFPGDTAIEAASEAATFGAAPDLYCSFGDVHAFTARSGGEPPEGDDG
jgi:hypothetical protein